MLRYSPKLSYTEPVQRRSIEVKCLIWVHNEVSEITLLSLPVENLYIFSNLAHVIRKFLLFSGQGQAVLVLPDKP